MYMQNMRTLFSGLKAEVANHRDWLMSSFGKYSIDELRSRMNNDIIMCPPGFTRRQTTFGFDSRYM